MSKQNRKKKNKEAAPQIKTIRGVTSTGFAFGLKDDSRIKLAMTNSKVPFETFLLAGVLDRLSALVWFKTTDGQKGINKPVMVAQELTGKTKAKESKEMIFDSGKDFEEYRQQILEKIGGED